MTCVIKQSLFTHQKLSHCEAEFAWQNVFTCQEINNLSYVLLSHLHRPLIAVQKRHALAWLYEDEPDLVSIQNGMREKEHPWQLERAHLIGRRAHFQSDVSRSRVFNITGNKHIEMSRGNQRFLMPKKILTPPQRQQQHKNIWNQLPN